MSYGIMRYEKRHWQAVKRLEAEANRSMEDHTERGEQFEKSMIDWSKTDENIFLKRTNGWRKYIDDLCAERDVKTRADSVCMVDTLYTASPEWMSSHTREEQEEFFRDCLRFHVKYFCSGDESLLINAAIHFDESTPHLQAASVPIVYAGKKTKKYRMNAKLLLGKQEQYRARQELFWREVASRYGMDRCNPKEDTRRRHIESNWFHAENARKAKEEMEQAYKELEAVYDKCIDSMLEEIKSKVASVKTVSDKMNSMTKKIEELDAELKIKTSQEYQDEYKRQMRAKLQEIVNDGLKARIPREWMLLQEKYPEIAKQITELNIQLKKDGADKDLPVASGIKTKSKTKKNENVIGR